VETVERYIFGLLRKYPTALRATLLRPLCWEEKRLLKRKLLAAFFGSFPGCLRDLRDRFDKIEKKQTRRGRKNREEM
jgi:hypothetical protein